MAKVYGAVTIDSARCKGCNLCVVACPCKVLALQPKEVNDQGKGPTNIFRKQDAHNFQFVLYAFRQHFK